VTPNTRPASGLPTWEGADIVDLTSSDGEQEQEEAPGHAAEFEPEASAGAAPAAMPAPAPGPRRPIVPLRLRRVADLPAAAQRNSDGSHSSGGGGGRGTKATRELKRLTPYSWDRRALPCPRP
jgi:hypothetical protein